MAETVVEQRDSYIYIKFKNVQAGDLAAAAKEASAILISHPTLAILIDDREVRYQELSASIKLEAVKAIAAVKASPKIAVVVDKQDEKLRYFASFVITTVRVNSVKVMDTMEEALAWLAKDETKKA